MNRPWNVLDKATIRDTVQADIGRMGKSGERQRMINAPSIKRDSRIWHDASRSGGFGSYSTVECAAWAHLYRLAYAGRLPVAEDHS